MYKVDIFTPPLRFSGINLEVVLHCHVPLFYRYELAAVQKPLDQFFGHRMSYEWVQQWAIWAIAKTRVGKAPKTSHILS